LAQAFYQRIACLECSGIIDPSGYEETKSAMNDRPDRAGRVDSRWDSGGAYETYVGRWSRLVAREFVRWLAVPPGSRWLDVGCGTGALAQTVLEHAAPGEVVGVDPSAAYVASAGTRLGDDPRARFEIGDAQELQAPAATFDAVVSGLVVNFVPRAELAVARMARVARPGGTVGAYVWDYAEGMSLMRHFWDSAGALDPKAKKLDEGRRFRLCHPEPLSRLFRSAGLGDVEVRAIEVPTHFRDFDDYWSPFLGGQGPAPSYAMSLSEERRAELRERVRASLPSDSEGGIPLTARAWAIRSVR
jgi:SAM-dependent methyltransferase